MANYKEQSVAGSQYRRCKQIRILNGKESKAVRFYQEDRLNNGIEEIVLPKTAAPIDLVYTPEIAAQSFPILNPETLEETGTSMTFGDVYGVLLSAYIARAKHQEALDLIAEQEEENSISDPVVGANGGTSMSATLTVSETVMNKILSVLTKLPYEQVAGLINEVQQDVAIHNKAPKHEAETPSEE